MRSTMVATLTLALFAVQACSQGDSEPRADTESPSASPTAVPTVSLQTGCELLFEGKQPPMPRAVRFALRDELTQAQVDAAQDDVDELREVARLVPPLADNVLVVADEVQGLIDTADDPGEEMWDTTAFKAAGLDVANTCNSEL